MIPLVLLPGMMCDARMWGPQWAMLSAHRALMHLPLDTGDTPEEMAAQALAVAPPRFAVAGLSMGGPIAMEMVRQAPDRVLGLALLATNHRAERPDISHGRPGQILRARANLAAVMTNEMIAHYSPDPAIRALCLDMAMAAGIDSFVAQSTMLMRRRDQTDTLRAFDRPALVLCGAQDTLCPPDWHRDMAALLSGSTLVVAPGAGHLPTLEQPGATTAALANWLDQI